MKFDKPPAAVVFWWQTVWGVKEINFWEVIFNLMACVKLIRIKTNNKIISLNECQT